MGGGGVLIASRAMPTGEGTIADHGHAFESSATRSRARARPRAAEMLVDGMTSTEMSDAALARFSSRDPRPVLRRCGTGCKRPVISLWGYGLDGPHPGHRSMSRSEGLVEGGEFLTTPRPGSE